MSRQRTGLLRRTPACAGPAVAAASTIGRVDGILHPASILPRPPILPHPAFARGRHRHRRRGGLRRFLLQPDRAPGRVEHFVEALRELAAAGVLGGAGKVLQVVERGEEIRALPGREGHAYILSADQVRCPIGPRLPQVQPYLSVAGHAEPPGCHLRPQGVATHPVEPIPLPGRHEPSWRYVASRRPSTSTVSSGRGALCVCSAAGWL